jgi:hypothetical protein
MDAVASLPDIVEGRVSLIETLAIPDLFLKPDQLRPEFAFLGSSNQYAKYYVDFERRSRKPPIFTAPAVVPELGPLLPLRRKHARHSYWKAFRLTIDNAKLEGSGDNDLEQLFLLLPLKVGIRVEPMVVNRQTFSATAFAYVFPFGACNVNLNVEVKNISFYDFIDLARKLNGTSVMQKQQQQQQQDAAAPGQPINRGTFTSFARDIAAKVVRALFGDGERRLSEFLPHKFLGVKETSTELSDFSNPHRRAIAASMLGTTFEDTSSDTEATINASLKGRWEVLRPGELRFFSTKASFFYPAPDWTVRISETAATDDVSNRLALAKSVGSRKRECMLDNYQSFLNETFALNRLLKVAQKDIGSAPQKRLDDLKSCLALAFPKDDSRTYFRQPLRVISSLIGFDDSLKAVQTPA